MNMNFSKSSEESLERQSLKEEIKRTLTEEEFSRLPQARKEGERKIKKYNKRRYFGAFAGFLIVIALLVAHGYVRFLLYALIFLIMIKVLLNRIIPRPKGLKRIKRTLREGSPEERLKTYALLEIMEEREKRKNEGLK
ncbi:MAG: hypothetical protein NTV30_00095 [Chloroflexi bacterium]|nr:hypothetical protein [Chloroflexota bacterium]